LHQPDLVYDIAISYASEQREYVEQFHGSIVRKGLTTFFDRKRIAQLWGEHQEVLYDVYYRKSKWCVMFISREYVSSVYPNLERRAILDRQLENGRYVLPVRFDDSVVPGLSVGIQYVKASDYGPEQLADLFEERFFTELG